MELKRVEQMLRDSLDDRKMSRAERGTLREILDSCVENRHERDWLRSRIFSIASESLIGPDAKSTVDWLEAAAALLVQSERATENSETQEPDEALFSPGKSCRSRIQESISTARTSVDVCVFTITDDRISDALQQAHQRRVRVRIISDNNKADDLGNDVDRLKQAGIPVVFDKTPHHMHHKFAIFDGRFVITGSYNWTRSAAQDNHENIVILNRSSVIRSFQNEFEDLWKEFSRD